MYKTCLELSFFEGFPNDKELTCQFRRHKRCMSDPWVRKIPWGRAWQPSPVFLPGGPHGRRSLVGDRPWGHKESDTTEELSSHASKPLWKTWPVIFWHPTLTYPPHLSCPQLKAVAKDNTSEAAWRVLWFNTSFLPSPCLFTSSPLPGQQRDVSIFVPGTELNGSHEVTFLHTPLTVVIWLCLWLPQINRRLSEEGSNTHISSHAPLNLAQCKVLNRRILIKVYGFIYISPLPLWICNL